MKSYSKFIIEGKKGTAVASPAPGGDPLDPNKRRKIKKKFSDPSNPPKVANPEAPKPKPEGVRQADVSKQAAKYRRAQRIKGAATGAAAKPTGSLSKGNLSFPGDRSGATARVKADIEARKGFSGSKSGGLKADETSKFVNRAVRQQRTVKQGIPDPFTSRTPAPADPFKGVTSAKSGKPSIPDPFKSATTKPKTAPKPKAPSGPGPATSQAIKDIRNSMSRRGVKTTEADVAQRYMRTMQDTGRSIDPDFVAAQGPKASGAKPEMVGKRAPSGSGAKFRAQADAAKDISKARSADLDKALKNLVTSGDVKSSKPSGPSSPIGFRKFSRKASQITKTYKDAERNFGKPAKVDIKVPKPVSKPPKVSAADAAFNAKKALKSTEYTTYAVTGKGPAGELLDKAARKRYKDLARTPFGLVKASDNPPALPGSGQTGVGSRVTKGSSSSIVPRKSPLPKKLTLPKPKPELASKVKDSLPGFKKLRPDSKTLKPASKLSKLGRFASGAGRIAGPALAVVGAGLDYADDRERGYGRTSSVLRTGAKHLGGAAGAALGSVAGPLGTAAGYAAGHWLTSKVLDKFHKPSKPKTPKQQTIKQRVKDKAVDSVRPITGTKKPKAPTNPKDYLKVNV